MSICVCVSPYSRAPGHSSFVDEFIHNLDFSVNKIHNGIQLKCGPVGDEDVHWNGIEFVIILIH